MSIRRFVLFLVFFLPAAFTASPGARVPLFFEQNHGQADPRYPYLARTKSFTLLLAPAETMLAFPSGDPLRIHLQGSDPQAAIEALDPLPARSNYFLGNDPNRWVSNARTYGRIRLHNVYPGIDLVYYGQGGQCENDFVVAPGADPARIRLSFTGAREITIDSAGDLVVTLPSGSIRWRKPFIYQEVDGARKEISGHYRLIENREVTFEVESYDRDTPLVFDPVLSYSSYLGGLDNESAMHVAVDAAGNAYLVGCVRTSMPVVTPGAFQDPLTNTSNDVLLAKISPSGSVIFETHIGGRRGDVGLGVAVDSTGIYLTGGTQSPDFPIKGGFQGVPSGTDAFVVKLSLTGDSLIYSTFLGGRAVDAGTAIAVDSAGSAYVTGVTSSSDFPVKGAVQAAYRGSNGKNFLPLGDAFVAKLDPTGASLVYSTYYGGSGDDAGLAIAVDQTGAAYVTGLTNSSDFPTTKGAFRTVFGGSGGESNLQTGDAFVLKLDASGQTVYSTYLGGSADDAGHAIAVDRAGNAYVAGTTFSANFPTRQPMQAAYKGTGPQDFFKWSAGDAFVAALNPTGSDLVYSTYLGGSQDDRAMAIALDSAGNAWVAGHTLSTDFPVTKDAAQSINHGYKGPQFVMILGGFVEAPYGFGDAFVAQLDSGGRLLYATYLGGADEDVAGGIAVDSLGHVYVVGNTMSIDFPVTNNAAQPRFGGYSAKTSVLFGDAFVSVFQSSAVTPPAPSLGVTIVSSVASVAAGFAFTPTVTVKNSGPGAASNVKLALNFSGAASPSAVSISAGSCSAFDPVAQALTCSIASLNEAASVTVTMQITAAAVGTASMTASVNWDNGTRQAANVSIAALPPAGSLQFALPLAQSLAKGSPVALALSPPNVFVLTSSIENYQGINLGAQPAVALPAGSSPSALLAVDLNGDSLPDLIELDRASGAINTWLSTGSAYNLTQSASAAVMNPSAMAPMNLSGAANSGLAIISDNSVALFTSNGDGTFTNTASFDVPGRQGAFQAVTAGSFTGAGLDDLVLADAGGNIWLLPSDGAGGFGSPTQAQAGANPVALAVADMNGDGALDLVVVNKDAGTVSLLLGDGAGTLGAPANFSVGQAPVALAVADLDGDGNQDIAVAVSGQNTICLLRGDGTGNFQAPLQYQAGAAPVAIAIGDLNGDGKSDIVSANRQSRDISLFLNQN